MKNLTFKAAMLNDSQPTVNRRSTDGQSQRHCKQTPLSKRWKVLMTLVFLFTFAIGQMWADTFTASEMIVQNSGKTAVIGTTKNHVTVYSPGITSTSSQQIWKDGNTAKKEATVVISADASNSDLQNRSGSYIEIIADDGYTLGTTIGIRGGAKNSSAKIAPIVWWKTTVSSTIDGGKFDLSLPENTITSSSDADLVVTIPSGMKIVRIYKKVRLDKTTHTKFQTSNYDDIGGGSAAIASVTATAVADASYKVTLNPNDGSYASTPDGWTAGTGVYTKSVASGTALAIPEPSRENYDFNGWKSGTTSVTLSEGKLTVSKDTTLVAQWETEKQTPEVTFNNGAYVVGASALDLSSLFTSQNTSTVSFALKVASDDATVSGSNFTATKEGSYVVVATQAADDNYKAVSEEATITVTYPAMGAATITYNVAVGTSQTTLATANTDDNSASISGLVGFTAVGVNPSGSGKDGSSPKLGTPATKDQGKYVYVTFNVADGKEFVLDSVVTKIVAVSHPKTIEIVVSDTEGTKDSLNYSQTNNNDPGTAHQFDFTTSAKAYQGTVTLKIYAYGADADDYRIGKPLKVCGTVQNAKVVKTTDYALTDVKVNGTSISAANLATLKTASASYKVDLADQFAAAPTIKFNKETTITYTDDSQKVTDEEISVDATTVDGKWQAQAEIGGITYTVTAVKVTSFTVNYFDEDGTTDLGSEIVAVGSHPTASEITATKDYYTFASWKQSDAAVALSDVSAAAGETVTLVASYTPAYATSINIEQWVLDNGAGKGATTKTSALLAEMGTKNYLSNIAWENKNNELDTLDDSKTDGKRNYAYLGLKVKKDASNVRLLLQDGKSLKVKFGNVAATPNIKIGDAAATEMTITDGVYSLDAASGDREITISTTSAGAVVFKQIMIDEPIAEVALPYLVTFNAGTGTCETAKLAGASVTLPAVTAPEDYTFAGWFDEATGGANKGLAGATYVPTDNVTLYAHFDPVKYTITYAAGLGSGEMAEAEAGWGTEYTALENGFTAPTGYIFAGWTVTGVDGVSSIGNLGSFTMPKGNVTLTAIWEDNSKVAMIVETSVKYETLAAAIAAAEAGRTVQLLQDIEQADGVLIDKDLVLDLNGKTYTCTSGSNVNSRAIKITDGDVTVKNGTIAAVTTANFEGGCYGAFRIEGATTNVTLRDLTMTNGRHYGLGIKLVNGHLDMEDCTVTSINGAGGLEVGTGTALVTNCTFTQSGFESAHAWIATCLATCYMGNLEVQGGTYTSEHYVLYVYSSGGAMDVKSGTFEGDIRTAMDLNSYPTAEGSIEIEGGSFQGVGGAEINFAATTDKDEIAISAGTFNTPIENQYCAEGYVPSAEATPGVYTVVPKDGIEIIGVVTTGGTNKTVSGLYKGEASVNLDSNKKLGGDRYIYVTLASGYTFEETDVLVVDVLTMSDLTETKNLEITTGVGNINGEVWKSLTGDEYAAGLVTIPLKGIAEGQTSIGLKRSANQNAYINGLKVYRPMNPILTAITINGVACDKGEGNTFSITLPEEGTNLASLEVVPTVIRNAAHATTPEAVISNSGAWKAGDNTYRVMDKDGDYTDYTITITLQGQAQAPDITAQPLTQAYCAGSEPTLEVVATGNELHYAWFKEEGETDEAVGTDAASYTIASAGTYYVVVTNHVDGKLDASTTSNNAVITLNVAAAITTQPTNKRDVVAGSEVTLSVVATNATSYQWYSCDDAEKTNASAIDNEDGANYVFNCNANGFYYCVVGNACGDDITSNVVSVKLEPEGCNTFASKPAATPYNYEQTGEWTFYNVDSNGADKSTENVFTDGKNFDDEDVVVANTRRFALKFEKDVESVTLYGVGGNDKSFDKVSVSDEMKKNTYTELTATATKTSVTSQQHIFTIEDMIIPAGKYAWFELSGSLKFFKICYTAALAEPKLPTLVNQELCAGAAYETFDATITNAAACEGTVSYEWYETTDTENPVATTASYTPDADGTYYVVVKHAAAGHATRVAQSANLTVAHFAAPALESYSEDVFQHMGTEATLSVTATGSGLAYAWYTCDAEGNDAEAITGAATASYAIASIAEGVQYYKVVISNTCDATTLSHIFKVEGWNQLEQVDVTETTVWNMANVADAAINLKDDYNPSKQNERLLLANIDGVNNNASFNAQALMFEGQHIGRTSNSVKHLAGRYLQFNVTKQGIVSVTFASNGDNQRTIRINDKKCANTTNSGTYITYNVFVQPGSVEIMGMEGASENQYIRIKEMTFTVKETPDYERPVSNNIGTLCVEHNVLAGGFLGATFYQIASRNELYNDKIDFEEVMPGEELKAGEPYIFRSNTGKIELFYGDSVATQPKEVRGMHGTYSDLHVDIDESNMHNILYIAQNKLWMCGNLVGSYLTMPENRAYIVMSEVPTYAEYTAQAATQTNGAARRRVTLGMNSTNVATGLEDVQGDNVQATKVLIDGQLYILRGEKMYDAKGQLVK